MARLREINGLRNGGFQFDADGRIVATPETMSDILHVLLDHRLRSSFLTTSTTCHQLHRLGSKVLPQVSSPGS